MATRQRRVQLGTATPCPKDIAIELSAAYFRTNPFCALGVFWGFRDSGPSLRSGSDAPSGEVEGVKGRFWQFQR